MKKKIVYLLIISSCIFIMPGCGKNNNQNTDTQNNEIKQVESEYEKLKSYLNSNIINGSVKSFNIIQMKNDMYDVTLNYDKNILYLHVCAEDSQYYARVLLETNNSLNSKINSLKIICKENDKIKYNININNFNTLTTNTIEENTILMDDKNNNLNKTVSQVKKEYIKNYKESCQTYNYKTIFRYAEDYEGKDVKYTGKVVQVIENEATTSYRVDVTKDKWGYYDDTIYVKFISLDKDTPRILEDDIITFYGALNGLYTYETVLGSTVTIPYVIATYIDIN